MLKDSRPKTITPDRGKEFSRHEEISKVLNDVQFYFPEPHQPWQRGTNENTNGLLREYFPKKQDLTEIKPSRGVRTYSWTILCESVRKSL